MSKWAYFTMGVLSGIVMILGTVIFMRDGHASKAYADAGMAGGDYQLMMGTGGLLSQTNDILYVVYKRKGTENERKLLGKTFETDTDRLTLCAYRASQQGGVGNMGSIKLMTAREISYDLKLIASDPETMKSFKDIKSEYDKEVKKAQPND